MFKRILVPTDGSEQSRHALIEALGLAKKFDSEIELVHVTPTQEAYYGYNNDYCNINPDQVNKNGELAIEYTLKGIDIGDTRLSKKHTPGNPASSILDEIKRDFDLVVMGTQGHGAFAGAVLGSVTQRVLNNSHIPVLIVK